jgi:hypothetical protein
MAGTVNVCNAPVKVNTTGLVTAAVGAPVSETEGAIVGATLGLDGISVGLALGFTDGTAVGGALGLEGI